MSRQRFFLRDREGIGRDLRHYDDHADVWQTWCGIRFPSDEHRVAGRPDRVPCRNCAAERRIAIVAERLVRVRRRTCVAQCWVNTPV